MKIAKAEKRRLHIQRLMMGVISFLLEEILMLILQLLLERDFLKRLNEINDSRGIFFELILYEAISESRLYGYMFIHVPFAVRQLGISGSTGV